VRLLRVASRAALCIWIGDYLQRWSTFRPLRKRVTTVTNHQKLTYSSVLTQPSLSGASSENPAGLRVFCHLAVASNTSPPSASLMRAAALVAATGIAAANALSVGIPPVSTTAASSRLAASIERRSECTRARLLMIGSTELGDGSASSADGGTFFVTLDGRDESGVSPEGVIPPGDDLIEDDLRRLFDASSETDMLDATEMDDLKVRTARAAAPGADHARRARMRLCVCRASSDDDSVCCPCLSHSSCTNCGRSSAMRTLPGSSKTRASRDPSTNFSGQHGKARWERAMSQNVDHPALSRIYRTHGPQSTVCSAETVGGHGAKYSRVILIDHLGSLSMS
jgi:hypothetical protein